MSLIQMNFFSECLNQMTSANVILPLNRSGFAQDLPVLYLLHGLGDDYSAWLRKTSVERYALNAGVAVIMPDGAASAYENMAHGERYNDYIALELPEIMGAYFPIDSDRRKTFIAGCSMGGFGALKIGLARPENYAAIGCFSAAHVEYRPESAFIQQMLYRAYDDDIDFCDVMTSANARATAADVYPVKILHFWGDEDILRGNAERARHFFEGIQSPSLSYDGEMLRGKHDWALWDRSIERFFEKLALPVPEEALY